MRFPLGLYRVNGNSMFPTLAHGQIVVGLKNKSPRPGDIVVIYLQKPIIKRLIRIDGDNLWIEGDNSDASTDSRQFGSIKAKYLEAVIIWPRRKK